MNVNFFFSAFVFYEIYVLKKWLGTFRCSQKKEKYSEPTPRMEWDYMKNKLEQIFIVFWDKLKTQSWCTEY